jgi:hypothetical protein
MVNPVGWAWYWPIVQEVVSAEIASPPKARPTPVFGTCHQAGTESVPFHISTDAKDMNIRFDGNGLVSSLVHWTRTGGLMDGMPSLGMSAGEPMHESRELTARVRPQDKMPVSGHGGICEQAKGDSLHSLQQDPFERSVVGFSFEQHRASNCSIKHVIDGIGRRSPWTSRHMAP